MQKEKIGKKTVYRPEPLKEEKPDKKKNIEIHEEAK